MDKPLAEYIDNLEINAAVFSDKLSKPVDGYVATWTYRDGSGTGRVNLRSNEPKYAEGEIEKVVVNHLQILANLTRS